MLIIRTQNGLIIICPIFAATSTSPQCILDSDRTIAAPVDYEGILKIQGASGLSLAITFKCKFVAPNNVAIEITELLAGAAANDSADEAATGEQGEKIKAWFCLT